MKIRPIVLRLMLLGAGLMLAAVVVELTVRLLLPESMWKIVDAAEDWQPDNRMGWVQKPNYISVSRRTGGQVVRFETNPDGLQPATAQRPKQPGVRRIMLFGDSAIVGRSVPDDGRIHTQLQRDLVNAGRQAEVINAGVEGYSTDQALIRMELLLPRYRPDVVIYCLCANDFSGNTQGINTGLYKPRFVREENGTLREVPAAPNVRLATLAKWPASWIHHSAMYGLLRPQWLVWRAQHGSWKDRNMLGLNDSIYYDPAAIAILDWRLLAALVTRMKTTAESHGARFLFYAMPDALEVWDPWIEKRKRALHLNDDQYDRFALEHRLQAMAIENRLEFVPMIRYFVERQNQGPFHMLPADRHSNGAGYQLTAKVLTQPVVSALENRPVVVNSGGN